MTSGQGRVQAAAAQLVPEAPVFQMCVMRRHLSARAHPMSLCPDRAYQLCTCLGPSSPCTDIPRQPNPKPVWAGTQNGCVQGAERGFGCAHGARVPLGNETPGPHPPPATSSWGIHLRVPASQYAPAMEPRTHTPATSRRGREAQGLAPYWRPGRHVGRAELAAVCDRLVSGLGPGVARAGYTASGRFQWLSVQHWLGPHHVTT